MFRNISIVMIPLLMLMVFSGCFFGTGIEKTVTPTIRAIGIPSDINIGSITLTVTDSAGAVIVEETYTSLPTGITVSIPEGNNITFELTINMDPLFSGTITSYKGTATTNIASETATVDIIMGIERTKIVVPDYYNKRILQFDDITGSISASLDPTLNPGFSTWLGSKTFNPYDIALDNEGRIYIANYDASTDSGIVRVDDILGTNPFFIPTNGNTKTISIDSENNIIYYNDYATIKSCDMNGNLINDNIYSGEVLDTFTFSDGFLYFIDLGYINKYNVSTDTIVISKEITQFATPWDVMVKDDKVYVANNGGTDGWKIIQLNNDLTSPVGYGLNKDPGYNVADTAQGHFYDPRRFVAILNKKITIIDETSSDGSLDKLVSIDDITGTNWQTLPESGDGQSLFTFYTLC